MKRTMKRTMKAATTALTLVLFAFAVPARAQTDNVTSTKHNLSTTPIAGVANYGEVCVYCHTPHGGSTSAPLWNKTLPSGASFTMYTSANSASMDMVVDASGPGPVSLACLSCHDGSLGLDAVINKNNSTAATPLDGKIDGSGRTNLFAKLGTDLRDDHPIAVTYAVGAGAGQDPAFYALATAKSGGVRFFGAAADRVECASCHNPHEADAAKAPFLRKANANSDLCKTCHIK